MFSGYEVGSLILSFGAFLIGLLTLTLNIVKLYLETRKK